MSITQILQQAPTLTNSIVKSNSQDYTQVTTSMKSPLESKTTDFRSAGFYKNLVDFHYSKIIDFGETKIVTTVPVAIELPLALGPVASNVSIDSSSSVFSSIFSQSNNDNNSFEDLVETLSNTRDRTRRNVSRAVQWYLGWLKANKSTISSFTGPKITNGYSECSMVKDFFGMTKCTNRDILAEQLVYSNYLFMSFVELVDLKNDVQAKPIDEPLLYEDYLVPRFFSLARSKQYLELEYNSHSAAMLWLFCHNPVNRLLMFQSHILDDFIALFEEPTSELPVFQEYWMVSFISLAESDLIEEVNYDSGMIAEYISMRNNPIPCESPYEPLVGEISELIESIVSTAAKEPFYDYLPAFLALSDAKGQEISQYDSLIQDYILPQFYKLVTVQKEQMKESLYDTDSIAEFMAATDEMLEEHKRKLAEVLEILDKILSFKDPMLELLELTQLKPERQFNEDTILRRRIKSMGTLQVN